MAKHSKLDSVWTALGVTGESPVAERAGRSAGLPSDLQQAVVDFYDEWCTERALPDIESYISKYAEHANETDQQLLRLLLRAEADLCVASGDGLYTGSVPKIIQDRKRALVSRYQG